MRLWKQWRQYTTVIQSSNKALPFQTVFWDPAHKGGISLSLETFVVVSKDFYSSTAKR